MGSSDVIAVLALIVSLASAYISYRAFSHSVSVHELESTLAFERDKSELLMHVEQSRNLFSSVRREIEQLQFVLSHEPQQVQGALKNYDNLFTEFLPRLVGSERQAGLLWDEIHAWRDKSGRSAFAHHTPRFRSLIENDRVAHDSALFCAQEVRAQLARVRDLFNRGLLG
ncbi:hypothetical protein ABFU27_07355 [Xanthomonas campestris pv. raphani]|uniref:hypothetical protein n=1 Tax=Xanthomonas campestris TaxID=339 RepID=UPI001E5BDAB5|nr:hypothetical protein [Xanthomonas campestris]MCC8686419.1 hypothetical protein [Xanthomonas campestris]MCC8691633.1 hypothetical protein [Xanthomonas campestris]MCW1998504.1 uncharacterized membrane-anchored protein YhcB (DUF1043 family) [Xanthomonas campestris]MEA9678652.1 hypothetical protein [Xanthomonas campestris pv. raphani]MEA9698035.1 hypothetical protein [Xanthomonas campestris pv. raphani]